MGVINKLRGVKFRWNDNGKEDFGLIAQEIKEIIPELVSIDERDYYRVSYIELIPFLIEGMKEQQLQIDQLKEENQNIKSELQRIQH